MKIKQKMKIFISYSWDNPEHQDWVLKLANELEVYKEIEIVFDQYELSAGKDMTYFMENAITSNKILVILTPNYKLKAEKREGGVGFEYSMITNELFDNQLSNKIIPVLRSGNKEISVPHYIKTKIYHNMQEDDTFNSKLFELLRIIFDKPLVKKPNKTKSIDFSIQSENTDELIELANNINEKQRVNFEIDNIIKSEEGLRLALGEVNKIIIELRDKATFYTNKTLISINQSSQIGSYIKINTENFTFQFRWEQKYNQSAESSFLHYTFFEGYLPSDKDGFVFEKPKLIKQSKFTFDMTLEKELIWHNELTGEKNTTSELIKNSIEEIIKKEISIKTNKINRL